MPSLTMIPEAYPISDLRTRLPEWEARAKESGEPIVLTRNGTPSLLLIDCQAYNQSIQRERHIRKLRDAEIEAKYTAEMVSVEDSRARIDAIADMLEGFHA